MKKQILFCLSLISSFASFPHKLTNQMLKTIDKTGRFDTGVLEIIQVRKMIKNLLQGKHLYTGLELQLQTTASTKLTGIFNRPETIFGITFVAIAPDHPDLEKFVIDSNQEEIQDFIQSKLSLSYAQRQLQSDTTGHFTGSYAIHPITQEKLPIYVTDYAIESYDVRITRAKLAVPAHNVKDFEFAQKHNLPIKLVTTGQPNDIADDLPVLKKSQLVEAFTRNDALCRVINSDFLNGSIKQALEAISNYAKNQNIVEYKQPILYSCFGQDCSIEQLKTIEKELQHNLSKEQKEDLQVIMNYIQSDFLDIVGQFLMTVHQMKSIMIDLIEESCQLRQNKDCYLLRWSQLNSQESEKEIFKRDITTFQSFAKFCTDLVDFLEDLASSCTHALENLKKIKNK